MQTEETAEEIGGLRDTCSWQRGELEAVNERIAKFEKFIGGFVGENLELWRGNEDIFMRA